MVRPGAGETASRGGHIRLGSDGPMRLSAPGGDERRLSRGAARGVIYTRAQV